MKKLISVLLTAALLFSCAITSSTAQTSEPPAVSYGDLDGDGNVATPDGLLILQSAVGKITLTDSQKQAADLNADGSIASDDALLILQFAVRLITVFPVQTNSSSQDEPTSSQGGAEMYKKYFTMSFDDGITQDIRFMEILKKYNLKCTFNINTGLFGVTWDLRSLGVEADHIRVTSMEVSDGLYDGFEVASHTLMHPNLIGCDDARVINETKTDANNIETLTGTYPTGLAYTGGGNCFDDRVISLILANTNIKYARTTDSTYKFDVPENFMKWNPTCEIHEANLTELAEQFIAAEPTDSDMIFYVWGHTYEFDAYNSWDKFEDFCELISGHDDIEYVTNGEIYNAVTKAD